MRNTSCISTVLPISDWLHELAYSGNVGWRVSIDGGEHTPESMGEFEGKPVVSQTKEERGDMYANGIGSGV
jgi:hypothetical protein